jgi:hypothetical protein
MRKLILIPLFLLFAAQAKPPAIPYSITLKGFSIAGFPGVHSAVVAGTPSQLVVLAGRRNGMHGFPSGKTAQAGPSFPKTEANTTVFVLDLVHQKLLGSATVTSLPAPIASQLQATKAQYQMLNGWLYIFGGYGPDPKRGTLTTLGTATAINFNALVSAVTSKKPLDANFAAANIAQFSHPALALTGGELALLPDASGATDFVLVFGQQYAGEYTAGGGLVQQTYANGVRVFQFTFGAGNKPTAIKFVAAVPDPTKVQQDPEGPFHRRDYVLKASIDKNGNRRLAAYGGVFKGGRMEGYLNPVFVLPGNNTVTLTVNNTVQSMSQYGTASIQLFDKKNALMYTTLFGGISQYYWNAATKSLKRDAVDIAKGIDGLPFINSVSTLKMSTATDSGTQFLHVGETFAPASMAPACSGKAAPYDGTDAAFVMGSVPLATEGVIALNGITTASTIGYIVGGIASTAPYPGPASCASATIYQVTLNPTKPTATVQLVLPP